MTILGIFNMPRILPDFPVREIVQRGTHLYYGDQFKDVVAEVRRMRELVEVPWQAPSDWASDRIVQPIQFGRWLQDIYATLSIRCDEYTAMWRTQRNAILEASGVDMGWNYFVPWQALHNPDFVGLLLTDPKIAGWHREAAHTLREGRLLTTCMRTYLDRLNETENRGGPRRPKYSVDSLLMALYSERELKDRDYQTGAGLPNIPRKYVSRRYISDADVIRIKRLFERGRMAQRYDADHNAYLTIA